MVLPLVETLVDRHAALKKLCHELYLAGTWTCPEIPPGQQKELWTRLRDQLGLPEGTATGVNVSPLKTVATTQGIAACICAAGVNRDCMVHGWQIRCRE